VPQKFSKQNLSVRDIVIRYSSKLYLISILSILTLQIYDKTNNPVFIAFEVLMCLLFLVISFCFFKINC
jgi:hypothetical protein